MADRARAGVPEATEGLLAVLLAGRLFTRALAAALAAATAPVLSLPAAALASPKIPPARPAAAGSLAAEAATAASRLTADAALPHPGRAEAVTHPADDGLGAGGPAGAGRPARALAAARPQAALPGPLGVDVSAFQGSVNWAHLAATGEKFAIVKATEGTYYQSPDFQAQYAGSLAAGMIRGAYTFAVPGNSSGAAQADYFVAHGGGWSGDGRTLPGMLDIEYNPYGAECYGLTPGQMATWVHGFDAEYLRLTGRYPLLYTNANWWDHCTGGSAVAADDPLDVAAWGATPGTMPGGWGFETIWQYSDNNAFGYDGDSFNGSAAGLSAIALGHPVGAAPAPGSPSPSRAVTSVGTTLPAGHILRGGEQLTAAAGGYRVIMQRDGNLVEYGPAGRAVWASHTQGRPGSYTLMAAGGDLVVVNPTGHRIWQSHTAGRGSSYATIRSDGQFAVYSYAGAVTWRAPA